ncbi:MAG: hypothetical protein WCV68_03290 [Candidatus Paceibacterota bacterium]|jgi:hypothetical protein
MRRIADYIGDVRTRTEEEKKRVVFLWTFIFIVIIFFVWALSFALSVSNNSNENARLKVEAERLALAKIEAAKIASSTDGSAASSSFKGVIPEIIDFASEGVGTVVDGFWAIGNMIHK